MQEIYALARDANLSRQNREATYYDKRTRDQPLVEGQMVLILNPRFKSNSLQHRWTGPARVTATQHPVYQVESEGQSRWLTRDKLKPYDPSREPVVSPSPPPDPESKIIPNIDSGSSSDEEGEEVVPNPGPQAQNPGPLGNQNQPRAGPYHLRPNPPPPVRLADHVVHE